MEHTLLETIHANEIEASHLDKTDTFKSLTHLFDMPHDKNGNPFIYLNGNSLGPKPKKIEDEIKDECEKWGRLGVRGHFDSDKPWCTYSECVTNSLARLLGAKPEEVVATGTLTQNIHFTFVSFYKPTSDRYKVIRLAGFPSDTYAIHSQVQQRLETLNDFNLKNIFNLEDAIIVIKPDEHGYIDIDVFKNILETHGKETSIIWIEAVHFATGQYFNIPEIAALAHQYGCKLGLDLAHAIGNVILTLHDWEIDFAVWCNYKYISAGPGAIAGLYVHEKYLTDPTILRFAGWWGHNKNTRFQMPDTFDPITTAESWQVSNSNIVALAALRTALDVFDQVDLHQLREKNKRLVAYLENLLKTELKNVIRIITPENPDERGCQLSLNVECGKPAAEIEKKLFDLGVVCDVRGKIIRVAPMGLYTTYRDIFEFVKRLAIVCHE